MGFVANVVTTRRECHIRKRESDKLKRQQAECQTFQTPLQTPKNGDKGRKGGGKGGGKDGTPNHNAQRRSSAPAAYPSLATAEPKKRPQGNNAFLEESSSKKRRLAWMAKSLMAAGVDVTFPDEE